MNIFTKIYYLLKDLLFHIGSNWDMLAPQSEKEIPGFTENYLNTEPNPSDGDYNDLYALVHYGEHINYPLRNDLMKGENKLISIVNTVAKYSCKKDIVIYRGVCQEVFNQMKENARFTKGDLLEKGFLYSSLLRGHEFSRDYQLRILVPAGSQVVYVGTINNEHRYETDVQIGSVLKIISIDRNYINCKLIEQIDPSKIIASVL